MVAKFIAFVKQYQSDIILGIAIVCITIISYNLGRMSAGGGAGDALVPVSGNTAVALDKTLNNLSPTSAPHNQDPRVVVSKASSSKLYHFTWCSGAKRISEKNKLYFPTESAAISAGYSLAGNCQK